MAEGLVGLRHLVRVLAALDRGTEAVHRVDERAEVVGEVAAEVRAAHVGHRHLVVGRELPQELRERALERHERIRAQHRRVDALVVDDDGDGAARRR